MTRTLGRYKLIEKLGWGGMGEVWRAQHTTLGRAAAVKLIRAGVLSTKSDAEADNILRRFAREARATSALRSPHSIEVYDFGDTNDGAFYYAMELLEGCNLSSLVEHHGPIPDARVVFILKQACESLAEAHSQGLIHRDIKPDNLFLSRLASKCDFLKVLDFGLVRLTEPGQHQLTNEKLVLGTPAFIPPEVMHGSSVFDARSDIYALGCVAYWLLTGQLVFPGNTPMEQVLAHMQTEPVPPSRRTDRKISADLEQVVMNCLCKSQDDRPQSAQDLAQELAACRVDGSWSDEHAALWWHTHHPEQWGVTVTPQDELLGTAAHALPRSRSSAGVRNTPGAESVVVLPFENMSSDEEQQYFSDGITEDIITDLSKVQDMFVIARNTSFTYKGRVVEVSEVCREVGVRYAVQGSVRKAGQRIRVSAQLIDSTTGEQVWAERYDRQLTDLFDVQDELTRHIVTAVAGELVAQQHGAHGKGTDSIDAYDCLLRARECARNRTRDANRQAHAFLDRAIELDPEFASAYSEKTLLLTLDYVNRWVDLPEQALEEARKLAAKSLELDGADAMGRAMASSVYTWAGELDKGLQVADQAVALNQNLSVGHMSRVVALHYMGRNEEALESLRRIMRLDPNYPGDCLLFLTNCNFALRRYDDAIVSAKRTLLLFPTSDTSRAVLAACYAYLDQPDEAAPHAAELHRLNPRFLEHRRRVLPYRDPADLEHLADGLRKAGL